MEILKNKFTLFYLTVKNLLDNERGSANKRTFWSFLSFLFILIMIIVLIWLTPEGTRFAFRKLISKIIRAFNL